MLHSGSRVVKGRSWEHVSLEQVSMIYQAVMMLMWHERAVRFLPRVETSSLILQGQCYDRQSCLKRVISPASELINGSIF